MLDQEDLLRALGDLNSKLMGVTLVRNRFYIHEHQLHVEAKLKRKLLGVTLIHNRLPLHHHH